MSYIETTCRIRDRIEIEKYYPGNFGAPGMPRGEKKKKTPEEMAKQNLWRKKRDLRRLIELNFGEGDWHVVLTCNKELRPSVEEAPKVIRQFRDKLARAYKKKGWDLKYIITCETGKRGAVHWHMIINDRSDDTDSTARMVRKLWARGRPYFTALDESGDYSRLADYIIKEYEKRKADQETIEKLSYMSSRNLLKPVVKKEKKDARAWRPEPRVPRGWELIPESLINGLNKFTGWPYQKYTIRWKGEKGSAAGGDIYRDKPERTGKGHRKKRVHHAEHPSKREGVRKEAADHAGRRRY